MNDLTFVARDGFHLSVNRRTDIQDERRLRMNTQVNAPIVKDSRRPEAFALQRELTVFVRAAELAPEPRCVNEFASDDVVWMSIFPVRRKDRLRSDLTENVGELLASFERVLQLPIR